MPIAPLVAIAVLDGLMDPALAILDLGPAVHHATGVVGALEIDDVVSDEEDRDANFAQLPVEALPQSISTRVCATQLNVFDEECDEPVEIARVQRQRLARCQLADLLIGDETLDIRHLQGGRLIQARASSRP